MLKIENDNNWFSKDIDIMFVAKGSKRQILLFWLNLNDKSGNNVLVEQLKNIKKQSTL